jgi:hypothetical protein
MTIYLYIKIHNITGLKYLGKTSNTNPAKYKGSGIVWTRHLKKYGTDITTTILKECRDNEEVKYWGSYYSTLWNIVEDPAWANLKPEEGDGGARKGQVAWNKGICGVYRHSPEANKKQSERQRGTKRKPLTEETKQKIRLKLIGRKKGPTSEQTKRKISLSKKNNSQNTP